MKPNIRIARGQPTTVDIHVIHLPRGVKTPLSILMLEPEINRDEITLEKANRILAKYGNDDRGFPARDTGSGDGLGERLVTHHCRIAAKRLSIAVGSKAARSETSVRFDLAVASDCHRKTNQPFLHYDNFR